MPATQQQHEAPIIDIYLMDDPAHDQPGIVYVGGRLYFFAWDATLMRLWYYADDGARVTHYVTTARGKVCGCSCPDARYRKRICRHQKAALAIQTAW